METNCFPFVIDDKFPTPSAPHYQINHKSNKRGNSFNPFFVRFCYGLVVHRCNKFTSIIFRLRRIKFGHDMFFPAIHLFITFTSSYICIKENTKLSHVIIIISCAHIIYMTKSCFGINVLRYGFVEVV